MAGKEFGKTFQTRALAESFRSKLITAQREGVAFDEPTGLPEPMARELNTCSWYAHAVAYVDMKWPGASAKHRKGIADTLATVTPALLATDRGAPDDKTMRAALYSYVFNRTRREAGPPPARLAGAVAWLEANTVNLSALTDAGLVRKALDTIATLTTGGAAAASTVNRKRAVFSGCLKYAVELRRLDVHPLTLVSWKAPRSTDAVDRRVVVNRKQGTALLAAVREDTPELTAFFGCMYEAALRPEEALHLTEEEYERPSKPGEWGWLHLSGATLTVGEGWGNGPGTVEDRELKHRAKKTSRDVPASPALCEMLDWHLTKYGAGPGGRLFVTRRGPRGIFVTPKARPVPNNTYTTVWRRARRKALTAAQVASPLAKRPYDLRHAAVSLWLNAGVPPKQVADWAGNSVHVLLRVYASCIDGQEDAARRRIEEAQREDEADS
ncbi:site-specific integrase [Luedemannella helvata]|uniref:Site-specific integrase n=1 Tax=Luedemannella helvata TaxID=349315 RepID=A0ABP4WT41_9ACTN